ncbi:MAG: UDP-N-acetylmuramoyl-tripeptide--D-alanyl-D-alanine ligase, partial [Oscillospiraceae bacterium]|nr:UDP-N-acetylmuramoyl-tripeptide--D-alanyl-D-alanine ligase [Oscillospiraceae bacterium]
ISGVLKAKSEVFEYMSESGLAVVNGDDEMLRAFAPKTRKLMFGYGKHNDIIAENVNNLGADGIDCNIVSEAGSFSVHVPGYGRHLILSVLPAVLIGRHFGMADEKIIEGIGAYKAIDGRSNMIDTGYIRIIDDCYNANPHSMTSAILSLAGLEGRHVAILGDMKELGRLSQELHREIGEFAGKNGVDSLICCGDLANFIYKGLIASGSEIEAWQFPMMDSLLSVLPSLIHEGDTVLVKASHSMDFGQITEALKKLR